jgi:ABC-type multidrug transport system fused ATPase/permease subunit
MRAFFTLFRASWKYAAGFRGRVVLYIGLFVLANTLSMAEPLVIGNILNSVQEISSLPHPMQRLFGLFMIMLFLSVGFWAFHGPARVMENTCAFKIRNAYKDHLYRIITSLPVKWHRDNHSGSTINRVVKSTRALDGFVSNSFQFIEMIMRMAGSVVALALIFPIAAVLAVVASIVALLTVFLFDTFLLKRYDQINQYEHSTASALHDYITNIFTVITLRLEELTRTEVWKRMSHYLPFSKRTYAMNEWKWFIMTLLISVMPIVVLAWYAMVSLRQEGVLLAGTFFMLYEYLQRIGGAFYTFAWKYSDTIEQYADFNTVTPILRAERADYYIASGLPSGWKKIEIKDLHFSYAEEELSAAQGELEAKTQPPSGVSSHRRLELFVRSMTLEHGKKIALVGESGSGKSTILALIRGLMTTNDVRVLCDGKVMKRGLKHLAPHVTLIPQDPEIFANTVEYNITVDTKLKKTELLEDIELARFSSVLARLPKGLKTDISEKGVNLSGGEKQRLALARGIFAAKTSDFILLDEPTSSVDSMNERLIYQNIFRRFPDRCVVSSIHKLYLLPLFDWVYVFRDGKIVAEGKPGEVKMDN